MAGTQSGRGARGRGDRRTSASDRSRPGTRRARTRSESARRVDELDDLLDDRPARSGSARTRSAVDAPDDSGHDSPRHDSVTHDSADIELPRRRRPTRSAQPRRTTLVSRLTRVNPKRAAVFALLAVFLALTLAVPVRTYLAQRAEFERLQASNAQLSQDVAEYQKKVVEQNDPAYIEAEARKRLQYVKRGERQVVVIHPGREEKEAAEKAERERNAQPWYTNLMDAVSTPPAEGK